MTIDLDDSKPWPVPVWEEAKPPNPALLPITKQQVWNSEAIMSANAKVGAQFSALMGLVRAVEMELGVGND